MKDILKEVISNLKTKKDGYRHIMHKRGWLNFLKDGDLVLTPHELHDVLITIVKKRSPRGEKLIFLDRHYNFTVMSNKIPYRKEEALERFITASNPEKLYNQISIGGGKESIDIGIEEIDTRFIFVELKPWLSSNSPLYAIIESLKNLIEYRIIHEKKIKHHDNCNHYNKVDLIVLAPEAYYREYKLIDDSGLPRKDNISIVRKALNDLSSEFCTNISLIILPIDKTVFDDTCRKVCDKYKKTTGQEMIRISSSDSIPELVRDQWKLLVSSDERH